MFREAGKNACDCEQNNSITRENQPKTRKKNAKFSLEKKDVRGTER